jgi:spore germination protein YaaH
MKNRRIYFVLLLGVFLPNILWAQLDKIQDRAKENQKAKQEAEAKEREKQKAEAEKANKTENTTTPANADPNTGRAIPQIDESGLFDYSAYPTATATTGKPKEEELLKEVPEIDSARFRERIFALKARESLLYRKGLTGKAPILPTASYNKKHQLNPQYKVFGWHPYWMGEAYKSYNFSLLSTIIYYGYEVNPADGKAVTIGDWETTDLIKVAFEHKVKILLSVSLLGKKDIEKFLKNRDAQRTCINAVVEMLKKRGGDGVHLDFEDIPKKQSGAFTDFVIDFATRIKSEIKGGSFTLSLPVADFERVYNLPQLNPHIDLFVMSAGEFYGANTDLAGPIAPIGSGEAWWKVNVERCVDEYLATGVASNKILLMMPYYGAQWITEGLQIPSKSKKFLDYPMYRDIRKTGYKSLEDAASLSAYITYRDGNNNYRQIWFEDSLSLSKKYDWVLKKKLGGVSIWALGYDNGYPDLWQALAGKFAIQPKVKKTTIQSQLSFFRRIMNFISRVSIDPSILLRTPQSFFSLFGFTAFTSMFGWIFLFRYGCRYGRGTNLTLKVVITTLMIIMLAMIILRAVEFGSYYMTAFAFLFGGFIIGALVFLYFSRQYITEKDLP